METKEKTRSAPSSRSKPSGAGQVKRRTAQQRKKAAAQAKRRTARKEQENSRRQAEKRAGTKKTEESRRRRAEGQQRRQQVRRSRPVSRNEAPEVVYTAPKPFNSAAFLLRLATVVAVVVALIFGISIFFRVKTVNVSGTEKYTPWMVMEASGIKEGDNLLSLSKSKVSGRITATLPYVGSVRVEIQLPDKVNIEVTELDVVYAFRDELGSWWLATAEGKVTEQITETAVRDYTQILGVVLTQPVPGQKAQASAASDDAVTQGSDRLAAAMAILQNLEKYGMIGQIDSVDVDDLGAIELWYNRQYQVKLGDTSRLEYKISCLNAAVNQMDDYRSGVLDISFTTWPDQLGYTPFDDE